MAGFGATVKQVDFNGCINPGLPLILPHCTVIEEIALSIPVLGFDIGAQGLIPKLKGMRLYTNKWGAGDQAMRILSHLMVTIFNNHGPEFKCLRISDNSLKRVARKPSLWDDRWREVWREWVEKWREWCSV
jgi:hypothetical protein